MKIRHGVAALVLVPLFFHAQAQTVRSHVEQAIASNPDIQIRLHALQASKEERNASAAAFLPRVDLSGGVGRSSRHDSTVSDSSNSNNATLSLTQLLYDGFATSNNVSRLDRAQLVRMYELFDNAEIIATEVSRTHVDVLRFRRLVKLAEDNYVRHKSVFELVQSKTSAGVARRVDLEQVSGRLALAESNLITDNANLHDVSARFQRLVGAAPGKDLADMPMLKQGFPRNINDALSKTYASHPALLASIENIRSANHAARIQRGSYQPRFDFRLRSERGNNLNTIDGSSRGNTAEVVMSWNLFNGGGDQARVRQFAEQINIAKDQRDKACRDLRQTLTIAFNDVQRLEKQLAYLDQHQLSIEKAREAYRKQFEIGQRTLLDVLDTENELFQARRAYVSAEYDLLLAYARTHAGTGSLLEAYGLKRPSVDTPVVRDEGDDFASADRCPAEGVGSFASDMAALNERAAEQNRLDAPKMTMPPVEPKPTVPAKPAAPVQPATKSSTSSSSVSPAPVSAIPDTDKVLTEAVTQWVAAWSARDVDQYLSFYEPTYRADQGTPEEWRDMRRSVIGRKSPISLKIDALKIDVIAEDRAHATFVQNYERDTYRNTVIKTLEWQKQNSQWLIVRESAKVNKSMN